MADSDFEFDEESAPECSSGDEYGETNGLGKRKLAGKQGRSGAGKRRQLEEDVDEKPSTEKLGNSTGKQSTPKNIKPAKRLKTESGINDSPDGSPSPKKSTSKSAKGKKTVEEIYQRKTQLEHILLRPDSYIGSIEMSESPMWVMDGDKMVYRDVKLVPGLYKIFDEILVNAADNKIRDPSMTTIKVKIDRDKNSISVYNNGKGIPVEMHAKEKLYVPELIFGHLLTSSNYDDEEEKVYRNNMSDRSEPKIGKPLKEDYTRITFTPDFAKFGMAEEIDDDLEAVLRKRVYDMAGILKGVKVELNGEKIKIKNFKEYVKLYLESVLDEPQSILYERTGERWEVSFVNGICTSKGGTHVAHVADQIISHASETLKKKEKDLNVKPHQIKSHMWLFVNCLINNPSFDSQTKENMTLKASKFGSKCTLSEDFLKKVSKTKLLENVTRIAKSKQDQQLKKTDGTKRSRLTGIAKLDDANRAGTKDGRRCTLILTEGDSAKTLAMSGLTVVGRDNFGVFPLRGKLLNVREASSKSILDNAEIKTIKQILGLQQGKQYTSVDSLRYGHVMIMADQDHDGSHIKGLLINLFDHFWPSLLKQSGFLLQFITPIIKISKGKEVIDFYTIPEYEKWREAHNNGKGWTIKYLKGLGTNTAADAKKYFSKMNQHQKPFARVEDVDRGLIDLAFNKKKADDRKEWLRNFTPGTHIDTNVDKIKVADFVNKELILFSMADNVRSIPSLVDGLKPGQRKILFACFKRNLTKTEIKVAQLVGYVAEHSAYHHGEASLGTTIINLAQDYVGSNNLTLLEPRGQFGTRRMGGKDFAHPRYIFTMLAKVARLLFHPADDKLLKYQTEENMTIEPEWYIPILPLVLVNGAEGIGTGWSTSIPNYNPRDIVENIRRYLRKEPLVKMHPWYKHFTGTIELTGDRYKVSGALRKVDSTTIEITELPLGTSTQGYKDFLTSLVEGSDKSPPFIKDFREYHTDTSIHFEVVLSEENMALAEEEGLDKKFKMTTFKTVSNMVLFDSAGKLRKYESAEEILEEFCALRSEYYIRRKKWQLDQLEHEFNKLDNQVRFIQDVISKRLVIQERKKAEIISDLVSRGYTSIRKGSTGGEPEDTQEDVPEDDARGYDYLLSMPLWNLTREKIEKLEQERASRKDEIDRLNAMSPDTLWEQDLDALLDEWNVSTFSKFPYAGVNAYWSGAYQRIELLQPTEEGYNAQTTGRSAQKGRKQQAATRQPQPKKPAKKAKKVEDEDAAFEKPAKKAKKVEDEDVDFENGDFVDVKANPAPSKTKYARGGDLKSSRSGDRQAALVERNEKGGDVTLSSIHGKNASTTKTISTMPIETNSKNSQKVVSNTTPRKLGDPTRNTPGTSGSAAQRKITDLFRMKPLTPGKTSSDDQGNEGRETATGTGTIADAAKRTDKRQTEKALMLESTASATIEIAATLGRKKGRTSAAGTSVDKPSNGTVNIISDDDEDDPRIPRKRRKVAPRISPDESEDDADGGGMPMNPPDGDDVDVSPLRRSQRARPVKTPTVSYSFEDEDEDGSIHEEQDDESDYEESS
ncbi:DNA topoisomerase 2 [Borealophlyctis nickersoniae]|nr:DNA topoisomerase 2 [Borealophlyctis nickersoniae]